MNPLQKSIIKTLLYFDIFNHPLHEDELYEFLGYQCDRDEFRSALNFLVKDQVIIRDLDFIFMPKDNFPTQERINKLNRSLRYHKIARFVSSIIFTHPFVRGVFVSGSLSKKSISKKDDIDFFLITEPGRLWVARAFLTLFKKVILFNSRKYFCINYYIDTRNLEIPEKNFYTAIEIGSIKPLQNPGLYLQFMEANTWIHRYFPNKNFHPDGCINRKNGLFKRFIEKMLNGKTGDRLDNYFMSKFRKRWHDHFGTLKPESFELNFKSEKHVSRHHPNSFQDKILTQYDQKIFEFESMYKMQLTD